MSRGLNVAVARDPASRLVLQQLDRLAPSGAAMLIIGESGTGKELAARRVHERSGRQGPFVAVNCGALTPSLAEAELLGHEGGSFTGASAARVGWFEAADRGTLLLDEISELPLQLQAKILRVLQEREVTRVGSRRSRPIDVRVLAASNVDLATAVMEGRFRPDLYYRLNVASVSLPPLRERRGDIVPLAEHFLAKHGERLGAAEASLTTEAKRVLLEHDWPGNIRELENVIQAALVSSADGIVHPAHIRIRRGARSEGTANLAVSRSGARDALGSLADSLDQFLQSQPSQLFPKIEEFLVRRALSHCRGNQVLAARLLGVPGNVMRTQLRRYGLMGDDVGDALASVPSEAWVARL